MAAPATAPAPALAPVVRVVPSAEPPEVRVVNRSTATAPKDTVLFTPEGSAEGCASGDCLPEPAAAERPAVADEPDLPEAPVAVGAAETTATRWRKAVDAVRVAFPRHGKSLSFARLVSLASPEVKVSFGQAHSFHRATVFGGAKADIEKVLATTLGAGHRLLEEKSDAAWAAAPRSIAELEADDRSTRERSIDGRARDSNAVRSVLRLLGGSVEHVQVLDPAPPEEPVAAPPDDEGSEVL